MNGNNIIYFDNFGVEHISKEIKKIYWKQKCHNKYLYKNIITNIYRTQAHDLTMCVHSCIGLIDFMLKGKYLLHYANLFSPNKCEKNDNKILKCFR